MEEQNKKVRIVKKVKQSRGITLIALVVTIVVLIILATISISAVLGENGLIARAEKAKQAHEESKQYEQSGLDNYAEYIDSELPFDVNSLPKGPNGKPLISGVTTTKHNTIIGEDDKGNQVVIPGKFKIAADSGTTVQDGIVIEDANENQFVWVPVSSTSFVSMFKTAEPEVVLNGSTGVKSKYYSNLRKRSKDSFTIVTVSEGKYSLEGEYPIREPDLLTDKDEDRTQKPYEQAGFESAKAMAEGFVEDYKKMRASVEKYEGFYIGRYELTGTTDVPTAKSGAVLTAYQAGNWYGLYKACRNVAKTNENVTSTMIWGCQWDETMNWLKNTKFKDNPDAVDGDSSSWGNYLNSSGDAAISGAGSLQHTGFSSKWSANNIYDLAGNCWEWTQEANSTNSRILRGGNYLSSGSSDPASGRLNSSPDSSYSIDSTRTTLYIN